MKKILSFILSVLLCASGSIEAIDQAAFAHDHGCYIETDSEIAIYRNMDSHLFGLILGSVGAGLFMTPGLIGLKLAGFKNSYESIKSGGPGLVLAAIAGSGLPMISYPLYIYLSNLRLKDKPVIVLNAKGLFCEGHGFHAWSELGDPFIVEEICNFRIQSRNILIPREGEKDSIQLTGGASISNIQLLEFLKKYKNIHVPSEEMLASFIPISLQLQWGSLAEKMFGNMPGSGAVHTISYCISAYPHDCKMIHISEKMGGHSK